MKTHERITTDECDLGFSSRNGVELMPFHRILCAVSFEFFPFELFFIRVFFIRELFSFNIFFHLAMNGHRMTSAFRFPFGNYISLKTRFRFFFQKRFSGDLFFSECDLNKSLRIYLIISLTLFLNTHLLLRQHMYFTLDINNAPTLDMNKLKHTHFNYTNGWQRQGKQAIDCVIGRPCLENDR